MNEQTRPRRTPARTPPSGRGDPRVCRFCQGTVHWSATLGRWLAPTGQNPGTCPENGLDHQVWPR